MIKEFEKNLPERDAKTFIAEGAAVIGKVKMKEFSSIWFNCTVRGDVNRIEIGRYSNVQDNSVLHVADDCACIVGDFVTVGHNAILHGCTVEDHCLIGMGAIVLNHAVIGKGSIIAAGSVVKERQIIPPNSLVMGIPGKIVRTNDANSLASIHAQAIKYKDLWTKRYELLPDGGGETYHGEKIV